MSGRGRNTTVGFLDGRRAHGGSSRADHIQKNFTACCTIARAAHPPCSGCLGVSVSVRSTDSNEPERRSDAPSAPPLSVPASSAFMQFQRCPPNTKSLWPDSCAEPMEATIDFATEQQEEEGGT